jgi:segregation and condensation protein A
LSRLIELVIEKKYILFEDCFDVSEGKMGMVVSFLAILELLKISLIDIVQTYTYGPIHLKAIAHDEDIEERTE